MCVVVVVVKWEKRIRGKGDEGSRRICEADAEYDGRVHVQQAGRQACRRYSGFDTRKFSPARKIQNGVVL
jgi:hypothetical protein